MLFYRHDAVRKWNEFQGGVKPCPFCGDAWVYTSTGDYGSGYEHCGYRVNCRCNFAWSAIGWNERKADVIAAWNRRADGG